MSIPIVIMDARRDNGELMRRLFEFEAGIVVRGLAASREEALVLIADASPTVVIVHVYNHDDLDDLEHLANVTDAAILGYLIPFEIQSIRPVFTAGALEVLTPPLQGEELFAAVRRLHDLI